MMTKDYYVILGVSRTESTSGIREAFRELMKRYHPDRVGPQGARVFQGMVEASQVLSDPERRKLYQQGLRHAEGSAEPQPAPIIVGQRPQPKPLVPGSMSVLRDFQTIQPSFEAVFERFLRNFTGIGVPKEIA
jgi:DnaJ-class molecular chaperone